MLKLPSLELGEGVKHAQNSFVYLSSCNGRFNRPDFCCSILIKCFFVDSKQLFSST